MLITKDKYFKLFDCIYIRGETLAYIAWVIREYYHNTIGYTSDKAFFNRYIIFNLASIVDWKVLTAKKKWQVDIDNFRKTFK